jgi:hypothetical protein
MKSRCSNEKHPQFKDYGGRGIKVSEEWLEFNIFKSDMYESYLEHVIEFGVKDTTIDRINNNKGYFKLNCRWATRAEQNKNKRNSLETFIKPQDSNKPIQLLGIAELGKVLNWRTEKTHVYYSRGKFIEPAFMVGKRPAWTEDQAKEIVNKIKG